MCQLLEKKFCSQKNVRSRSKGDNLVVTEFNDIIYKRTHLNVQTNIFQGGLYHVYRTEFFSLLMASLARDASTLGRTTDMVS